MIRGERPSVAEEYTKRYLTCDKKEKKLVFRSYSILVSDVPRW